MIMILSEISALYHLINLSKDKMSKAPCKVMLLYAESVKVFNKKDPF